MKNMHCDKEQRSTQTDKMEQQTHTHKKHELEPCMIRLILTAYDNW